MICNFLQAKAQNPRDDEEENTYYKITIDNEWKLTIFHLCILSYMESIVPCRYNFHPFLNSLLYFYNSRNYEQ